MLNKSKVKFPKTLQRCYGILLVAPWNKKTQKQSRKIKPISKSFEAFIKILKSRTLNVGNYQLQRWLLQKIYPEIC